jgi:hypothetical protein
MKPPLASRLSALVSRPTPLYYSTVLLHCTTPLYYSTVLLHCTTPLYLSPLVSWLSSLRPLSSLLRLVRTVGSENEIVSVAPFAYSLSIHCPMHCLMHYPFTSYPLPFNIVLLRAGLGVPRVPSSLALLTNSIFNGFSSFSWTHLLEQ